MAKESVKILRGKLDVDNLLSQLNGKHSINSPFHSKNVILLL